MDRADEARRVTSEPLDASEPEHLWLLFELSGSDCTAIITNTPHNTDEACAIVRNLVALVEGQKVEFAAACSGRFFRRNPLLLAPSVDRRESRKPDARLRVVRLAEGATERPVVEGSRRQVRNDHGAVSSEPANARLTAETKPFRGRKTSQSAYIALMRSTTAASTWMKPLAPIALHGSPCRAVGQCRGDGAIGRTFRGATQSPLRTIANDALGRCRHVAKRGAAAPSQSRVPISTLIGRFSSMRRACSNDTVRSSCSSTQV